MGETPGDDTYETEGPGDPGGHTASASSRRLRVRRSDGRDLLSLRCCPNCTPHSRNQPRRTVDVVRPPGARWHTSAVRPPSPLDRHTSPRRFAPCPEQGLDHRRSRSLGLLPGIASRLARLHSSRRDARPRGTAHNERRARPSQRRPARPSGVGALLFHVKRDSWRQGLHAPGDHSRSVPTPGDGSRPPKPRPGQTVVALAAPKWSLVEADRRPHPQPDTDAAGGSAPDASSVFLLRSTRTRPPPRQILRPTRAALVSTRCAQQPRLAAGKPPWRPLTPSPGARTPARDTTTVRRTGWRKSQPQRTPVCEQKRTLRFT